MEKLFIAFIVAILLCINFCKAPHPPHPPNEATTAAVPTTDSSENSTGPVEVMEDQCSTGNNFSSPVASNFTSPDRLYVDFGWPASCTGVISRWEACFMSDESSSNDSIYFAIIRYDHITRSHEIKSIYELTFQHRFVASPGSSLVCGYVDAGEEEVVPIKTGDLFGFVGRDSTQVVLTALPEGMNSMLRAYSFTSDNGTMGEGSGSLFLGVGEYLPIIDETNETYSRHIALIRVIISE